MRHRIPILLIVGAALAAAAFWWLNFHAAASDTRAGLQLVTMSSNPPSEGADGAARSTSPAICVVGDAHFADGLRIAVERELAAAGIGISGVCPPSGTDATGRPILVVKVVEDRATWTPVYSTSSLRVSVAYASDGDVTWAERQPVVMPSGVRTVRAEGSVTVDDESRGLYSRPAYRRHLGEAAGSEIGKHFAKTLRD